MAFLTPLFLVGLAALAAPVLLHLIDRSDDAGRRFPSLMLVRRLPYRARRRRVLRDRALLALRCLALVLLVLGFARPLVVNQTSAADAPAVDTVILLDVSYSMATGDRWARAQAALAERLAASGSDERVALVVFDAVARTLVGLDDDIALVPRRLGEATPGHGGTDLAGALQFAGELLAASPARRKVVLLVSDLQAIGIAEGATMTLPDGVVLEMVAVGREAPVNASLELLEVRAGRDGGPGVLKVRVVRNTRLPPDGLELVVEVDGRVTGRQHIASADAGQQGLELPLPAASLRPARVTAKLSGDELSADDSLYLVLAPDAPLHVVLVLPESVFNQRAVFLERALAVARKPRIELGSVTASGLTRETMAAADVIVLADAMLPNAVAWTALRDRVAQGGGLLLSAGERLGDAWPADADWLPGRPGGVREAAENEALALRWRDRTHPLSAALGIGADGEAALLDAAVRRYRRFTPGDGDALLAVFDDDSPALLERRHGAGRIMLYTSTMDDRWGALAATPVFAPLLVGTVLHLAGRGERHDASRVGEVLDLARHAASSGALPLAAHLRGGGAAVVRLPNGESVPVSGAWLDATQPGFHEVFAVGADLPPVSLAVNVDTRESDAALLQPEMLLARLRADASGADATRARAGRRADEQGADRLWWWLLLAASLVLVTESLLARRLVTAGGRRGGGDA